MMLFTENGNTDGGGGLVTKLCLILPSAQTAACQAPLSKGFPRQEHWSELPLPSPGNLPNPGIKPSSPQLQVNSLPTKPQGKPFLTTYIYIICFHFLNFFLMLCKSRNVTIYSLIIAEILGALEILYMIFDHLPV